MLYVVVLFWLLFLLFVNKSNVLLFRKKERNERLFEDKFKENQASRKPGRLELKKKEKIRNYNLVYSLWLAGWLRWLRWEQMAPLLRVGVSSDQTLEFAYSFTSLIELLRVMFLLGTSSILVNLRSKPKRRDDCSPSWSWP